MPERYILTFDQEEPDSMQEPITLLLSRKVRDGYLSVWPTGGRLYSSQIIIVSKDGRHTKVLRSGYDSDEYSYYKNLGYHLVNGTIPQ